MENLFEIYLQQIQDICPKFKKDYLSHLNLSMSVAEINTPQRASAFIAQLAHESGGFIYMEEIHDGSNYENRKDLGNINPGDGMLFKGRGPIQLTGRANYQSFTKWMNQREFYENFEKNPELVAQPKFGFLAACWYWCKHNLNQHADENTQESFDKITRIINGGFNGKKDRDKYYKIAKDVFKC